VKNVGKPCKREAYARIDGGGWRRSVGHGRSESCPGETPGRSAKTYRRATPPRQSPTLHGRYYRTALNRLLKRINTYLMRWAQQKYKRLRPFRKALRWWKDLTARQPHLFAHWAWENEIAPGFG
jgi:hypothetical protein